MKNLSFFLTSRYRAIVLSIALFIVFDLSILLMNFYISSELSKDAGVVNLAAQMRMMSQRMIKSLYEIDEALEENGNPQVPLTELKQSYQSFNEALLLFQQGGNVTNLKGENLHIERPSDPESQETLKRIEQLWIPYKNILSPLVGIARIDSSNAYILSSLRDSISYGSANNISLLKLSTELGERIEMLTARKVSRLKTVQVTGMSFALINFVIILFHFIGRLRSNDMEVEKSRKQTEQILDTVQEGLLLIDRDGHIGEQHSAFITNIFPEHDIAGELFLDLLKDRITSSDLQVAEKYIRLLFKEKVNDKLTLDLNPLKRVELHKVLPDGRPEKNVLSFNFSQILSLDGSIEYLLVTLKDISELIQLEDDLKQAKDETDGQLQIIKNILRSDPKQYETYLLRSLETLNHINSILEQSSRGEENYRKKIDEIFIEIHRLKGDSSTHNMSEIAANCHEMENELSTLKASTSLKGDDFMVLTIKLKELIQKIESYSQVAKKLSEFGSKATPDNRVCSADELLALAETMARKDGKNVELLYSEIGTQNLDENRKALLSDLVIQLLRNAVIHGIEPADIRRSLGKPDAGKVMISILKKQDQLTLSVRDDGAGINFSKLKEKARNMPELNGLELDKLRGKELLRILFISGLSSAEKTSEYAGRGVGMNLVKDIVNKLNGKISLASTPKRSTSFQFLFPIVPTPTTDKKPAKELTC